MVKRIFFILAYLYGNVACASEQPSLQQRSYDASLTCQLQKMYQDNAHDTNLFLSQSGQMKSLIEANADPNITVTSSLLTVAISDDETELVEACLKHGAQLSERDKQMGDVKSTQVADLLIQQKVDPTISIWHWGNLLHYHAQNSGKNSKDLLALFANAGVEPNYQGETGNYAPLDHIVDELHGKFCSKHAQDESGLNGVREKMAILLWTGADPTIPSWHKQLPLQRLRGMSASPVLADSAESLVGAVSAFKGEKQISKQAPYVHLLSAYVPMEPAKLIVEYGVYILLPWKNKYWPIIKERMAVQPSQDLEQNKTPLAKKKKMTVA